MAGLYIKLKAPEQAIVDSLRRDGENISEIVREALRQKHEQRKTRKPKKTRLKILDEILARFPTPPTAEHHGVDLSDRKAVSAHIRKRLRAKMARGKR